MADGRSQYGSLPFGYQPPSQQTFAFIPTTFFEPSLQVFSVESERNRDILESFDFDAFLHGTDDEQARLQQRLRRDENFPTPQRDVPNNHHQSNPPGHPSREQQRPFVSNVEPASQRASESPSKVSPPKIAAPATRKPIEDECPVCWEPFLESQRILFCKTTCGNNFHKSCVVEWLAMPANRQVLLKCPMCRGPWDEQELKELMQENGIEPPRPSKRLRGYPHSGGRNHTSDHLRRAHHRQRAYERRTSGDRSRVTGFGARPNFPARLTSDVQPQMSPGLASAAPSQPRPTPMMAGQPPPNGEYVQVSQSPRQFSAYSGPPSLMNNGVNSPYGMASARMTHYPHYQPVHASPVSFHSQANAVYPSYSNLAAQNFPPANNMPSYGFAPQNRHQNVSSGPMQPGSPAIQQHPCPEMRQQPMQPMQQQHRTQNFPPAPMQFNAPALQQHPCPAMRQQPMQPMQQLVHPSNFAPHSPISGSTMPWEFYHLSLSYNYTNYTVYSS